MLAGMGDIEKNLGEEKLRRRRIDSLKSEIQALKNILEELEHEYFVKEAEKDKAIDLNIEKKKLIICMMENKKNRIFAKFANEIDYQTSNGGSLSLISCYEEAMSTIKNEISKIMQEITEKRRELNSL